MFTVFFVCELYAV